MNEIETTEIGSRLSRCYTGVVHDVMRDLGLSGFTLPSELRPILPGRPLAGPAWTYSGSVQGGIDAHQTLLQWTGLLSSAPSDHVLVCQPNDRTLAHTGELSGEALQIRGVRGMVIDGGARDVNALTQLGFPVFCRYFTPRDIVGQWVPHGLGEPVVIGEVTVHTGDYVLGDRDGVLVLPAASIEEVVGAAEQAMSQEDSVREAVRAGQDPREAYLRYGKF